MELVAVQELARSAIGAALAGAGVVLLLASALGLLRFPDAYTRLHAASVGDGLGAVCVVLGLLAVAPDWTIAARLLLLGVLLAAAAPMTAHALASAAHVGGLAPIVGRYIAPRPGVSE